MPKTKNADARYRCIDTCLSDHSRKYTFEDIKGYVSESLSEYISTRQLRDDLAKMQLPPYNAPIKAEPYERRKSHYVYTDPDYRIYKTGLSDGERDQLRATIDMLGRYRKSQEMPWVDEILCLLECKFDLRPNSNHVLNFDENKELKGADRLPLLVDAACNQKSLEIIYLPFVKTIGGDAREVKVFTLDPYFLKQYNNRWFLFGYNHSQNAISNIALDRIVDARLTGEGFTSEHAPDLYETYFKDVIGVTVLNDAEPTTIKLRFTPRRFPYVTTKPLHQSQETLIDEPCTITIKVKPNPELYQQLLSFGPDVEVLSPTTIREEMRKKVEEMYKAYS